MYLNWLNSGTFSSQNCSCQYEMVTEYDNCMLFIVYIKSYVVFMKALEWLMLHLHH
jgi:hypothetical protein